MAATLSIQEELFCRRALPAFIAAIESGASEQAAAETAMAHVIDRDAAILNWMYSSQRFEDCAKDAVARAVWNRLTP